MEQETAASAISRMEWRLGELHKNALLNSQRDRLGEIDALLARLPQQVAQLRTRGYVYKSHLEEQLGQLAQHWQPVRSQAIRTLEHQAVLLRPEVNRADEAVRRLQPLRMRPLTTAQPTINRVESQLSAVERRVRAAQEAVENVYDELADELEAVGNEIKGCERILEWLAGATFALNAGEGLVAATEARTGDKDERTEGILFLTDQRMVFERREKVARKKFLFITTESELVKEVSWEAALSDLERIDASEARKALVFKREMLAVVPRRGSRIAEAQFELDTDSDTWRALLLRCQTGEIASDRVGGAPPVPEYTVPAKCPFCGASISQAGRVRGIASVQCDYCGQAIELQKA
ncbi:MAG: hypothetical protein GX552_16230 [Chloroflexi bacterium]|nr:hypothetical protein [Chloroflexota bacterium]